MSVHEARQVGVSLSADPFQVPYPFAVYQDADSAIELCEYTLDNMDDESKIISVATTNVIIDIFSSEVIQPLQQIPHILSKICSKDIPLDNELVLQVQKIASHVLSFIPTPQAEPAFLSKFRPDLTRRAFNVFRSRFPQAFNILAMFFRRTRGDTEEHIVANMLSLNIGGVCDAIGCECFRRLDEIDIPPTLESKQKVCEFLSKIENARELTGLFEGKI